MKTSLLKHVFCLAIALLPALGQADEIDLSKDFDSLGGNEMLLKKAKALDPKNRVSIVQKRVVDRRLRLEIGANYGGVVGGDSYMQTQTLGGNLDFHITPRWSIGGRYYNHFNSLTNEGRQVFDNARTARTNFGTDYQLPSIDYPLQSALGVVSFYPIYGKTNLFDLSVVQFDIYMLAGYGQVKLNSGWTDTMTAGGGFGFWLTQYLASRLEGRWQTYEDSSYAGSRRLDIGVMTVSLGLLL
jgi:outer membrane immunogenic protein